MVAVGRARERRYYCQNWRADVSAILTDEGSMVEWVKYSAYGVPFGLPAGDTDSDGDYDITDRTRIANGGAYDVRKDVDLDGTIKAADITAANAVTGGYHAMGRGVLSAGGPGGAVGNRRGYAGYEYAPELEGTGAAGRHLYHVRHRVYDADVGRWTRRDPLGYVDGMGLYEYVRGMAINRTDVYGLYALDIMGANSCKCLSQRKMTTNEWLPVYPNKGSDCKGKCIMMWKKTEEVWCDVAIYIHDRPNRTSPVDKLQKTDSDSRCPTPYLLSSETTVGEFSYHGKLFKKNGKCHCAIRDRNVWVDAPFVYPWYLIPNKPRNVPGRNFDPKGLPTTIPIKTSVWIGDMPPVCGWNYEDSY